MAAQAPLAVTPSLASAINRQVLKVFPETSIAEVIRQMSAVEGEVCAAATDDTATDNTVIALACQESTHRLGSEFANGAISGPRNRRASCAIIVTSDGETLTNPSQKPSQKPSHRVVGILTERDIVQLTATQSFDGQSLENTPVSALMTTPVKTMEESDFQDIFAALFLFRRYRIRHLPIVDNHDQLIGVVTPASIRQVLRPANLLKMHRVGDVMGTEVIQAPVSASVMFLAQLMAKKRVSCVVIVIDNANEAEMRGGDERSPYAPVGIVTERDIVQFQSLGLNLDRIRASVVMSTPLFLLDPQDSLWAAHEAMKTHRIRRLVVSWNWGKGLGIITQTSMLRVFDPIEMYGIIDSLQHTIRQLKKERQRKGGSSKATPPFLPVVEVAIPEAVGHPNRTEAKSNNTQPDSAQLDPSVRSIVSGVVADECPATLLDRAIACVTAVRQSQLTAAQRQQLSQATQLIQQVRDAHVIGQDNAADIISL